MTSCREQWKPPVLMVAINFAFAIVNVLFKKILDEGTNQMVIVTYRLAVSTLFLTPIAFFLERYVLLASFIDFVSCKFVNSIEFFFPFL